LAIVELAELVIGEESVAKKNKSLLGRLIDVKTLLPRKSTAPVA